MRIIWRTQALADLRDYISRDNPPAADRTAGRIRQSVLQLATFPQQRRPGRRRGTRELMAIFIDRRT